MFRSLFRASYNGDATDDFWYRSAPGGPASVTPDSALALTAIYACVRVISESFAVLPFVLYRPKVGGGRERVTDHWAYWLFAKRPNRWQTPFEFREMLQGHLALRGNAMCQIVDNGAGGVAELVPMHPDRVTIELVGDSEWRYRYSPRQGGQQILRRDQVWHLRGLGGDGVCGYNPIELARETIGEGMELQSYSARFFRNNATPPMWIEAPGVMADRGKFRESVQEAQTGANRGKVMVLDRGLKLHAVGVNLKDLQFIESRKDKIAELARIFRVPPHKIADLSKATFSNIEQQSIEFWSDCMQPWCERWESSIESALLGPDSELEVEFDMRAQMRGDSVARAQYIHNMVLDGVLTRNEGRAMEGFDPIDGLDEPLIPSNERQLSDPLPQQQGAGAQGARLASVLRGNAARMSRRLARGEALGADTLAEALAITPALAQNWLDRNESTNEQEMAASLAAIAG